MRALLALVWCAVVASKLCGRRRVTPSRYCTLLVLLQLSRQDFVVYMAALLFTLGLGIEEGILIACGLGLALVLRETTKPHWARLQRVVRYQ